MIEVRCPYCNALQFKAESYAENTAIEIKCRGRNCGRILRINVTATIQIVAISTLDISAAPTAYKPAEHK